MKRPVLISTLTILCLPAVTSGKRPPQDALVLDRTIEEVVTEAGFTPTPTQDDTYRPGVVLIPRPGGHDELVPDCVSAEVITKVMSDSQIATTLAVGVHARIAAVGGTAGTSVTRKTTFVDPERRTIPLGQLTPTEVCQTELSHAARLRDLSDAVIVYEVLVARIWSRECKKVDAKGQVVGFAGANTEFASECVVESPAQVPIGYRAEPLLRFLGTERATAATGRPAEGWSLPTGEGLDIDAKLRDQTCRDDAIEAGQRTRAAALAELVAQARDAVSASWASLQPTLERCSQLPMADRKPCIEELKAWIDQADAMSVTLPQAEVPVSTTCGPRRPAFLATAQTVSPPELKEARELLQRLSEPTHRSATEARVAAWKRGPKTSPTPSMVRLEPNGTTFQMGAAPREKHSKRDETSHPVTLQRSFWLATHEVTQSEWKKFQPSWKPYDTIFGSNPVGDKKPIYSISWCEALEYANWLSEQEGLQPAYRNVGQCSTTAGTGVTWDRTANGYRLPTEAEWEYAAKAGAGGPYVGGRSKDNICSHGNIADRSALQIRSYWDVFPCDDKRTGYANVGEFQPNPFGLYDMTGNVWEWVWDAYGPYPAQAQDPIGFEGGQRRVFRGGSHIDTPPKARVARRRSGPATARYLVVGLRLARYAD